MKTCLILPLVVFASISAFGQGDPFEAAVGTLVNSTVEAVKSSGNKKLAVLDVRDLQDLSSPFGRYLAEQLSVGLVMAKGDFTVVDRMNLKSILAEHKLSEEGLVNPANAKVLGQFSGVDALVIGTLATTNSGHSITIKIVSTDKAEIVAATKGKLPLHADYDAIVSAPATPASESAGGKVTAPWDRVNAHEFNSGGVRGRFKRLQILESGEIVISLDLADSRPTKETTELAVSLAEDPATALPMDQRHFGNADVHRTANASLTASTGDDYAWLSASGIAVDKGVGFYSTYLPLSRDAASTITLKFKPKNAGRKVIAGTTTFSVQAVIQTAIKTEFSRGYKATDSIVPVQLSGLR